MVFYLVAMVIVGMHLPPRAVERPQSLGVIRSSWTARILRAGRVLAVLIAGGFS